MNDGDFRARVVLLGASNVTKGLSVIAEASQSLLGSPIDLYCAIGHGRSYGTTSRVLIRSLPSILDSALWDALKQLPRDTPTYALIADVGNDIMYDHPAHRIVEWSEQTILRLEESGANIVMTGLPLQRIARLNSMQFLAARTLFFPTNRLTLYEARSRAESVSAQLQQLADQHGVPLIQLPVDWYGLDPIHIRSSMKAKAWNTILHQWVDEKEVAEPPRGSLRRWLRLRSLSPYRWWLLGMQRGRPQPAALLDDGTRVSMY